MGWRKNQIGAHPRQFSFADSVDSEQIVRGTEGAVGFAIGDDTTSQLLADFRQQRQFARVRLIRINLESNRSIAR